MPQGDVMSEAELIDAFEVAWRNEGFLTREHEEARLEAGRAALRRFRAEQLQPGARIPAYVEREFTFTFNGDRIRGRWDRVDIEPVVGALDPAAADDGDIGTAAGDVAGSAIRPDVMQHVLPLMPRSA